ncbi:MAG: hypothetical protein GVY29_04430 [Spirochaetes bacterium]|jgi:hypothetical protein|nr:hypothetical protein [Spirochaetota bacterium]
MARTLLLSTVATAAAALVLAGCDLYNQAVAAAQTTPFPQYLDETDGHIDLSDEVLATAGDSTDLSYDLAVVQRPGRESRILLLVEPPSSDPDLGFNYRGRLFLFDRELNLLSSAAPGSSFDYFGRPYTYAHDDNLLVAYTVLSQDGQETDIGTLDPNHGLEGFAFTNGTETYLFASPSGEYAAFVIDYAGYNEASWGRFLDGTLTIIPEEAQPTGEEPNISQLGYQLVGIAYNEETTEITFMLSEPSRGRVVAARTDLETATSGSGVLLPDAESWQQASWPVTLEVDRPDIHVDEDGFFVVRRDGWLERYSWTRQGELALQGERVRVVGDRSLTRQFPRSAGGRALHVSL